MRKTVFITGTSSGIGLSTALYFANHDWNVVATMRTPDKCPDTLKNHANVDVYPLDVLDYNSILKATDYAIEKYKKIDVLINNAGFALFGPLEAFSRDEIARQYNTNVNGLIDMTTAFLPHFKQQQDGVILNIASVAGRLAFPYYSLYNSTKWAVEGLSDALAFELAPFHVRVKLFEPGIIKTNFYGNSMLLPNSERISDYAEQFDKAVKNSQKFEKNASHPDEIAIGIYKAANDKSSRLRYHKGKNAFTLLFLRKALPDCMFRTIIRNFMMH